MAAHELATNAVKYGALSGLSGRVEVRWGVDAAGETPRLWLSWSERDGPPVNVPTHRGFGSRLIERGLAGELNGIARLDYRRDGLVCTIEAPLPIGNAGA